MGVLGRGVGKEDQQNQRMPENGLCQGAIQVRAQQSLGHWSFLLSLTLLLSLRVSSPACRLAPLPQGQTSQLKNYTVHFYTPLQLLFYFVISFTDVRTHARTHVHTYVRTQVRTYVRTQAHAPRILKQVPNVYYTRIFTVHELLNSVKLALL